MLANASWRLSYDFTAAGQSTAGLPRTGATLAFAPLPVEQLPRRRDHGPGDFARKVELAKEQFRLGNLFECARARARVRVRVGVGVGVRVRVMVRVRVRVRVGAVWARVV